MGIIATARVPSNGDLATIRTIELPKIKPPVVPISSDDPDQPHTSEWSEGYVQGVNEARQFLGVADAWMSGYKRGAEEGPDRPAPVWPPKTCPSWCSYDGDHGPTEGMHPVDRHHSYNFPSEDAESVYLSLHPSDLDVPPRDGGRDLIPQRLVLDMQQPYRELEPTIHLIHMDRGWKRSGSRPDFTAKSPRRVKLTPAEARRLADRLVLLADLAAGVDPAEQG